MSVVHPDCPCLPSKREPQASYGAKLSIQVVLPYMASPSTPAEAKATNASTCPLYSKLPTPTSIRLLRIEPPSAPDSDQITCTLTEYPLSNSPVYKALSYTWNSPSPETAAHDATKPTHCPITINSQPVLVTRNLFDFLLSFRKIRQEAKNNTDVDESKEGRDVAQSEEELLWIDAVCINQSDTAEKTHQVRLMTQIYSLAGTVYIWLGRILPDEDAERTLGLLFAVWDLCEKLDNADYDEGSTRSMINAWDGMVVTIFHQSEPGISKEDRQRILSFFRKTWFSRIWIVQEVVVAKETVMFWGEREIPWGFVIKVASYMEMTPFGDYIKAGDEEDCQAVRGCGNGLEHYHETPRRVHLGNAVLIANLRRQYLAGGTITLGKALTSTWQFQATDKRDVMFALLGIVEIIKPDDVADELVVDYSLSAETIFEQTIQYLWKVERSYGHILDVVVPDPAVLAETNSPAEAAHSFKYWLLCSHFAHYTSCLVVGADPPGPMPAYLMEFLRDEEYDVIPNVFEFAVIPHPWSPTSHMVQNGASFHNAVQCFEEMQLFVTKKGFLGLGPATLKPGDTLWGTDYSKWSYAMRDPPAGTDDSEIRTKKYVGAVYVHGLAEGQFLNAMFGGTLIMNMSDGTLVTNAGFRRWQYETIYLV